MNLLVRDDGAVYLVTRHNVMLLRDTDTTACPISRRRFFVSKRKTTILTTD